jgi:hypothetical protein
MSMMGLAILLVQERFYSLCTCICQRNVRDEQPINSKDERKVSIREKTM